MCYAYVKPFLLTALTAVLLYSVAAVKIAQGQTVTALYNFSPQSSSAAPQDVALAQGRDGELYGTSQGNGNTSDGSIFKVSSSRIFAEIFDFDITNGCCPGEGLILGSDGNFYGAAGGGGNERNGVLFKVTANGTYTDIYDFSSSVANPFAPPIQASDGNFYGTTANGGPGSTIYKFTMLGDFTTIYQFDSVNIGAPLIQASDGFLYGTTGNGGWAHCGTIFKMSTAGSLLQSVPFLCNAAGSNPSAGALLQASDGNFYGTTVAGGLRNGGTVFKMTPDFKISILYSFMGKSAGTKDGFTPVAGLIQATDGNLYGATFGGGANGMGTLYRISTGGAYQLLYSFNGAAGKAPLGSLMQHTNGTLYGTAEEGGTNKLGTVYQVNLGLAPFITFVQRTGSAGQTVQILGQKLTGATSVTFNGVPATSFTVASPTFLLAIVPSGATSGPVVVTTPTATLTSNVNFNVLP